MGVGDREKRRFENGAQKRDRERGRENPSEGHHCGVSIGKRMAGDNPALGVEWLHMRGCMDVSSADPHPSQSPRPIPEPPRIQAHVHRIPHG